MYNKIFVYQVKEIKNTNNIDDKLNQGFTSTKQKIKAQT